MNAKNGKIEWYLYFIKHWLPIIILLGIIFWLSGGNFTDGHTSEFFFPIIKSLFPQLSPEDVIFVHELIRKFAHIVEYFFLGLLLSLAFSRIPLRISSFKKSVLIIALLVLFALGDELHQFLVTLRKASVIDLGLDMTGGLLSLIVCGRKWIKTS